MTLNDFFCENSKLALAFSGGVDSAFLLHAALSAGADIRPYCVRTVFQPRRELDDVERLGELMGIKITVIPLDVLSLPAVATNPPDRCYHCKTAIMTAIRAQAEADGYPLLIDGTNASDAASDRPGMRALTELGVRSPLRECGLTKADIRRLSKAAGLPTWDKPAYACLATRIPAGEGLNVEKLARTERAEDLLASLGFRDFRVRTQGADARLELREEDLSLLLDKREEILKQLKTEYPRVLMNLETR